MMMTIRMMMMRIRMMRIKINPADLYKESHLNEDGKEAAKSDDDASMSLIPTAYPHLHPLKYASTKIQGDFFDWYPP